MSTDKSQERSVEMAFELDSDRLVKLVRDLLLRVFSRVSTLSWQQGEGFMVWLAFDIGLAAGGLALLVLGRWLLDLTLPKPSDHRISDLPR